MRSVETRRKADPSPVGMTWEQARVYLANLWRQRVDLVCDEDVYAFFHPQRTNPFAETVHRKLPQGTSPVSNDEG